MTTIEKDVTGFVLRSLVQEENESLAITIYSFCEALFKVIRNRGSVRDKLRNKEFDVEIYWLVFDQWIKDIKADPLSTNALGIGATIIAEIQELLTNDRLFRLNLNQLMESYRR